ncbi:MULTISPECIES: NAD(P)/FAD-dependent oxidoreductase [unclassified Acinetobacter]|uniref:NAD(P)/FAD-dependent oxidoreductase n=1 Tax=unclassified Acinetobacter TaxID=196816 RepID=UPI0029341B0F|nr:MULTISPECIES: NAD(P)-binding protein [unclassified Acinetobacter]WOE32434.1 NAD(P)-binding protein [Acinetobacter sp. SAAs470]WOE37908.1 NAD(P)-binding protein [Acinetobacter sp. SAAs474]
MKIAIIGSGISGLYAAWKLSQVHEVTLFEKNHYFGGHTDTHQLTIDGDHIAVDSGFIVFNAYNYPLFSDMLDQLGVTTQSSDMSFSVNNQVSQLQYNPSQKFSLLLRPQNFLKADFRRMLADLLRFYATNKEIDVTELNADLTIEQYLDQQGYSQAFRQEHLYPMCGALWSCPVTQVGQIPYKFVIHFFQHHRMLQLKDRPLWQTVKGGSASYVRALQQQSKNIDFQYTAVHAVTRTSKGVQLETAQGTMNFDWVVLACHADDSLKLLQDPSTLEQDILQQFRYQDNTMVVHSDCSIMPKSKRQWASWHVHVTAKQHQQQTPFQQNGIHYGFTYWMNRLQNLPCKTQVFATLNPNMVIDPKKIWVQRQYRHPIFDAAAIGAQQRWSEINQQRNTSYCGAYWGWGFHEDGARSASWVVEQLLQLSN